MLRTVLVGLCVLVLGVFLYVGYNSYAVGRRSAHDEVYTGANTAPAVEPKSPAGSAALFPATPVTGPETGRPKLPRRVRRWLVVSRRRRRTASHQIRQMG